MQVAAGLLDPARSILAASRAFGIHLQKYWREPYTRRRVIINYGQVSKAFFSRAPGSLFVQT